MIRSVAAICIALALASNTVAQDYLLRLDTVVSELFTKPGVKSKSETVSSIEVIAQPGGKFYAKTSVQGTTYTLTGRLQADPQGRLLAELTYRHAAQVDMTPVQMASAKKTPAFGTSISTTLLAVEGKPLLVSGKAVSVNGQPAQQKEELYFTITKFTDREL